MAEVRLVNVSKSFGDTLAIDDLSLQIGDGELVVLLGPTGAGKTTTLRLVAGLERADRGTLWIDGRDMTASPPADRDVAFVFQQYSLYPHLSVYDNLAFPLRSPARRVAEPEIRTRVEEIAGLLHIESKLRNRATQLSGGEMQRVAIGRALVRRPSIYLMDEPLSSLDAKLRSELRLELKHIQRDLGATILYVTHDQIEAMTMASRIGVINNGELVQVGTPREIYEQPRNLYVASRLGTPSINLLPATALPSATLPAPLIPEGAVTLGARTEHCRITAANGHDPHGKIQWIEHLGDQNHLHVTMGEHKLTTLADPYADLKVGDPVRLELINPLYFDAGGERIDAADGGRHRA